MEKLILFGSNDSSLPGATGQHVDLETYRENLKSIITHPTLAAHRPRILLVTPPPIDEEASAKTEFTKFGTTTPVRSAELTARYADAVLEVKKDLETSADLVVVNLHERITELNNHTSPANSLAEYLSDGLHLSSKGYQVLYDEILASIQRRWPQDGPDFHPFIFPYWRDLVAT